MCDEQQNNKQNCLTVNPKRNPLSLEQIASVDKIPPKKHSQERLNNSPRLCEVCGMLSSGVQKRCVYSGSTKVNIFICDKIGCNQITKPPSNPSIT